MFFSRLPKSGSNVDQEGWRAGGSRAALRSANWANVSRTKALKKASGLVTRAHALCRRANVSLDTSPEEDMAHILFEDATGKAPSPMVPQFEQHWYIKSSTGSTPFSDLPKRAHDLAPSELHAWLGEGITAVRPTESTSTEIIALAQT